MAGLGRDHCRRALMSCTHAPSALRPEWRVSRGGSPSGGGRRSAPGPERPPATQPSAASHPSRAPKPSPRRRAQAGGRPSTCAQAQGPGQAQTQAPAGLPADMRVRRRLHAALARASCGAAACAEHLCASATPSAHSSLALRSILSTLAPLTLLLFNSLAATYLTTG